MLQWLNESDVGMQVRFDVADIEFHMSVGIPTTNPPGCESTSFQFEHLNRVIACGSSSPTLVSAPWLFVVLQTGMPRWHQRCIGEGSR